ncbi:MAG: DNA polymerase IV [Spirochaetales bacterium]|nr:DNA polymerase IV [Spirochaetales bacterium]
MTETESSPVIFHADLDAFFASVEQSDRPELRGKPVIVGARPGRRGVVSACSYEARAFGVRSALPISQAVRLCPQGVFLPVRMERYIEVSNRIMRVLEQAAPEFCQISIDEAFMDFSGTARLLGEPGEIASLLKRRIRDDFGLTISVGIAPNRYLAKMASQFRKPDGLFRVRPGEEEAFLDGLLPADLWGVGKKTAARLAELNLTTVASIRTLSAGMLSTLFGKAGGSFLHHAVRGIDPGIFTAETKSRSLSSETTFESDRRDAAGLKKVLLRLAHEVMFRLLYEGLRAKTVVLKIRLENFETVQAQETRRHWVLSAEELYAAAVALLEKKWNWKTPIRLLGLGLSNVTAGKTHTQGELFEEQDGRKQKLEAAVLKIRRKYDKVNLTKARLLEQEKEDPSGSREARKPGKEGEKRRGH